MPVIVLKLFDYNTKYRQRIYKMKMRCFTLSYYLYCRSLFWFYSQTTSKLKCVGSPCRIIYTVFGKPPVSLLKLFDYKLIINLISGSLKTF